MSSAETVFISGASGFIALHTIDALLESGYRVIGTVRSTEKGDSLVKNFKTKYPKGDLSYEIVKDIVAEGAFDEALKAHPEIKYVLHTASPFSFGLNKSIDDAYLKPAIDGTRNMLKGIKANAPQVTNVVVTSSYASIMNVGADPKTFVHTEKTWNPITIDQARENESNGYVASKKLAEETAWKFVETEKPNFKLSTVCPPYVLGPQEFEDALSNENLNTSAEIINGLLKSTPEDKDFPIVGLAVDVRDVAKLHVLPLSNSKLEGERLFPASGAISGDLLLQIINKNFPELKGKIAPGDSSKVELAAAKAERFDISQTVSKSGIEIIPLEKTVVDSVKQILDYKSKN